MWNRLASSCLAVGLAVVVVAVAAEVFEIAVAEACSMAALQGHWSRSMTVAEIAAAETLVDYSDLAGHSPGQAYNIHLLMYHLVWI